MSGITTYRAPSNGNVTRGPFSGLTHPNQQEERIPSQIWINIGYPEQDADGNERFVATPVGLPIDTMKEGRFAKDNELLKTLIAIGQSLQPGEDKELNLQVRIRRVKDKVETVASTDLMSQLLGTNQPANQIPAE